MNHISSETHLKGSHFQPYCSLMWVAGQSSRTINTRILTHLYCSDSSPADKEQENRLMMPPSGQVNMHVRSGRARPVKCPAPGYCSLPSPGSNYNVNRLVELSCGRVIVITEKSLISRHVRPSNLINNLRPGTRQTCRILHGRTAPWCCSVQYRAAAQWRWVHTLLEK
jgi:hypothetical protein